ncbi:hypothetical protein [Flavobacterium sp. 14A]|uniref:hypothetical protein n=1 Tax=Flavobacterium sp. 14A TaxID=2735896 RepID=UPI00156EDD2E|nr:hypothetical protein [Flavobacterium sp. 14A]NRT13666.1 hypothetical protein [Flavobacterium sp. 14A]
MMIEKEFDLREILIKTNYQIVINKDKSFENFPIAYGSGFFLNYQENLFFLTADHNLHYDDHQKNERLGDENYVGILNNISFPEKLSTIITPIGGFYFMESFNISKPDLDFQLFDVAISLVDRTKFEAPFLTDENLINEEDGSDIVSPKELKYEFLEEHIIEPNIEDTYFIYGKIKPELKGLFLHRQGAFKNNLKFIKKTGAYLLLNTENTIKDYKDWAGLSGSPVLNQEGKCIGVLCSVIENTNSIFVKPFKSILPLLQTIPIQEKILREKK